MSFILSDRFTVILNVFLLIVVAPAGLSVIYKHILEQKDVSVGSNLNLKRLLNYTSKQ